jgi:hypothetical protein
LQWIQRSFTTHNEGLSIEVRHCETRDIDGEFEEIANQCRIPRTVPTSREAEPLKPNRDLTTNLQPRSHSITVPPAAIDTSQRITERSPITDTYRWTQPTATNASVSITEQHPISDASSAGSCCSVECWLGRICMLICLLTILSLLSFLIYSVYYFITSAIDVIANEKTHFLSDAKAEGKFETASSLGF